MVAAKSMPIHYGAGVEGEWDVEGDTGVRKERLSGRERPSYKRIDSVTGMRSTLS
jgi:hypothetical protein